MNSYKVCILMATYNGEKYLIEQIDSILNQTYSNWQLLIIDDKSTDKTYEILKNYEKSFPDKIVLSQNKTNSKSAKTNFITLIKQCPTTYDYYMFCDQDDIWLPDKIKKIIDEVNVKQIDYRIPVALYTDLVVVDKKLNVISPSFYKYVNIPNKLNLSENLVQNNIAGCTLFFNKAMLIEIKKINNVNKIYMHDWFVSLIGNSFGKLFYIDTKDILYRQHDSNSVGARKGNIYNFIDIKNINQEYKKNQKLLVSQAKEFYKLYADKLSTNQKNIICAFIGTSNQKKIKRILTYYKYGFIKKGFMRKIKQLIFG